MNYSKAIDLYLLNKQTLNKEDQNTIKEKIYDNDLSELYLECNDITSKVFTYKDLKEDLKKYSVETLNKILTQTQIKSLSRFITDEIYLRINKPEKYLQEKIIIDRIFSDLNKINKDEVFDILENVCIKRSYTAEETWSYLEENLI